MVDQDHVNTYEQRLLDENARLRESIKQKEVKYLATLHQAKKIEKDLGEQQRRLLFERNFMQERLQILEEDNEKLKREFRIEKNLRSDYEGEVVVLVPEMKRLQEEINNEIRLAETLEKELKQFEQEEQEMRNALQQLSLSEPPIPIPIPTPVEIPDEIPIPQVIPDSPRKPDTTQIKPAAEIPTLETNEESERLKKETNLQTLMIEESDYVLTYLQNHQQRLEDALRTFKEKINYTNHGLEGLLGPSVNIAQKLSSYTTTTTTTTTIITSTTTTNFKTLTPTPEKEVEDHHTHFKHLKKFWEKNVPPSDPNAPPPVPLGKSGKQKIDK